MTTGLLINTAVEKHRSGDYDAAARLYHQALLDDPSQPDTWNLAGVLAMQVGRTQDAVNYLTHAVQLRQGVPDYYLNLASALVESRREQEAEKMARKCLKLSPRNKTAWNVLGLALLGQGRLMEADRALRKATGIDRNFADAWANRCRVHLQAGRIVEAELAAKRALEINPEHFNAVNNLGACYRLQNRLAEACMAFRQVLELRPTCTSGWINLGNSLRMMGKSNDASVAFQRAVDIDPKHALAWACLGVTRQDVGQFDEAVRCLAHALKLNPQDRVIGSSVLFALNLSSQISRQQLFSQHVAWGQRHRVATANQISFTQPPDRDRRLRIGYVSPDLRQHPLVCFLEPMLTHHDRQQFEIYAYAELTHSDRVTERLQSLTDGWHNTYGRSSCEASSLVRDNEIDILIDLAGHTANNRLDIFAERAAPIQVTMIGYLNTTGMEEMDYCVSDAIRDPEEDDEFYMERIVRLPGGGVCWQPPDAAPDVNEAPLLQNGTVTFGSTHRPEKITRETASLWAQVLHRIPDSRLLVFHNQFSKDDTLQSQLADRLAAGGVDLKRVSFGWDDSGEYLPAYLAMGVLLEAIPWSSGTTAFDAMWMGVPIPTLYGDRPMTRATASVLHRLGLPHLIAKSADEYIEILVGLSRDPVTLGALRAGLRDRVRQNLCDAAAFVREFESALRSMWHVWCDEQQSGNIVGR
ncbi:MAG: tetratricopeptide repeat protein [Planctomycetales bacterium]|nr:tetratricopeptide repeat protein [Planctomycetales bacterium]